jgi:katanin p60 ATPase-containing subunit A1
MKLIMIFMILFLFRPSPGPRKRQSPQYSDPKPHGNRPSTAVRAHRPSAQNLHNDRGKAVRCREKKEQNKGREEKVNVTDFRK